MRTNVVIDDRLMAEALEVSGARTKREAIDLALRNLVRLKRQAKIRKFRGRLSWDGDLDAMRADS